MGRFLIRRLLTSIPLLLSISIIAFTILHLAPGGPLAIYATTTPNITPEQLAQMEEELGLRDPLHIQYIKWLQGAATGHWGFSFVDGRPASSVVLERLPNTIQLTLASLLLAMALGVPIGIFTATRPNRLVRYVTQVLTMFAVSMPTFWLGLMVILLFSETLGLLPSGGMSTIGAPFSISDRLLHLVAPAVVLATPRLAEWVRYTHSSMVEVMQEDYIRTARAKGLAEQIVRNRHALKNVAIVLVTLLGLSVPVLFSGALVTEAVFAWPGNGRLLVDSLIRRDYPVVMGSFMIIAVLVVVGNLLADLAYGWLDPRVRYD